MTDGFHIGMAVCAGLSALGGILAWFTISDEVLHAVPAPGGDTPERTATDYSCGITGTPLRPGREADCVPADAELATQSAART